MALLPLSLGACNALFGVHTVDYADPDAADAVDAADEGDAATAEAADARDAATADADAEADVPSLPGPDSRAVGFTWKKTTTKQVEFVAAQDNHIYEMAFPAGAAKPAWSYADVTIAASAPAPDGRYLDAYASEGTRGKHIVYAVGGEIHDLALSPAPGAKWTHANLSALAAAPRALPLSIHGYATDNDELRVAFAAESGEMHVLVSQAPPNDGWVDVTLGAIAPTVGRSAFVDGYATARGDTFDSEQIVYFTDDGHIHEIARLLAGAAPTAATAWTHTDLTALVGAPSGASRVVHGYAFDAMNAKLLVYVGEDHHVHELASEAAPGSLWKDTDLSVASGGPSTTAATLDAYVSEDGAGKRVIYEDDAGDVHELAFSLPNTWTHTDPSANARFIAPNGVPASQHPSFQSGYALHAPNGTWAQIVYPTDKGHLIELYQIRGNQNWSVGDLTVQTGAPTF